jgi:CRP-like cAMP-binding protein
MSDLSNWPRNRLLLALSPGNLKRLMPELERIHCEREQVLMDADSSLDHVFFPDSGVISVLAVYSDGSVIEMATIGREGCTDAQAIFGARISSVQLLVQIPGSAAKISRAAFLRAMQSMPSFRSLMYAYASAFLEQVMVSVACNGAHSLKERLAQVIAAQEPTFTMQWLEEGGPTVAAPSHNGYGQIVIGSMAAAAVDGTAEIDYRESGLSWKLSAPVADALEGGRVASFAWDVGR